ncbi:NUDIX hydrolase [Neisseria animaloris]|uniref:NUDIX hydrolase n=1 Tax=Neisseria animaloris TaxID=326522 RepID=UPI000D309438|nr:CoA pyrophosphatase [Neisseria animaloris]
MTYNELSRFLQEAARYPALTGSLRNHLFAATQPLRAAVLLAVVCRSRQWEVLLTRRSDTLRHHTGQIALAGGRCDPQDNGPTYTALRETAEETGIASAQWQTFPPFEPYYTPSGYAVFPVPALSTDNPPTQANADEVAEIFYVPLAFVLDKNNYQSRELHYNGRTLSTPTLPYLHYDIWGLTATILYDLAERYEQHTLCVSS